MIYSVDFGLKFKKNYPYTIYFSFCGNCSSSSSSQQTRKKRIITKVKKKYVVSRTTKHTAYINSKNSDSVREFNTGFILILFRFPSNQINYL